MSDGDLNPGLHIYALIVSNLNFVVVNFCKLYN